MASITEQHFEKTAEKFKVPGLKEFQKDCISWILLKKSDVFVCARTGSGKSLCFQTLVYLTLLLDITLSPIVVVLSPLVSLMQEQVQKLNDCGFRSTYIGKDASETKDIKEGRFQFLYSSPENVLGPWRHLFSTDAYRKNLVCLVFDEVHTCVSWGTSSGDDDPFREDFSRVAELRAYIPECPLLALTATASATVRQKIRHILCMKNDREIIQSPDRENITLRVIKVKDLSFFEGISKKLNSLGNNFEKTIIYCRRIADCAALYGMFRNIVTDKQLFDMFHSRTITRIKTKILEGFKVEGNPRILIATNAVGMGLDFKCNFVVNYGPPSDFDGYLQQIGRVGRDGSHSQAILIYSGQQLRKLSPEMLQYVKNVEKCRRKLLRELYGDSADNSVSGCKCCDICRKNCACTKCDELYESKLPESVSETADNTSMYREVSEHERKNLQLKLLGLKHNLDLRSGHLYSGLIRHGLSMEAIHEIMTQAEFIFDIDSLLGQCGLYNYDTACDVLTIFSEMFGDTDVDIDFFEDSL